MRFMATAKKAVKKAAKRVRKATQAVAKFSPEWYAAKKAARERLDNK